jgi:hypothetical protein
MSVWFQSKEKQIANASLNMMLVSIGVIQEDIRSGKLLDSNLRIFAESLPLLLTATDMALDLNSTDEQQAELYRNELYEQIEKTQLLQDTFADITERCKRYGYLVGLHTMRMKAGLIADFNEELFDAFMCHCIEQIPGANLTEADCEQSGLKEYICGAWWNLTNGITQIVWQTNTGKAPAPRLVIPFNQS